VGTSPDGFSPAGAFGAGIGPGYQNADPEAGGVQQNLWLTEALEEVRNQLLNNLLGGFLNVPAAISDGIVSIVVAITGALGDLADLAGWALGVQTAITTNTEAIAALQDIAPASPVTPAYVADIDDMASCGRGELIRWAVDVDANQLQHRHSIPSSGSNTGYENPNITTSVTVSPVTPLFTPEVQKDPVGIGGKVYYWPVVADRKGHASLLHWNVGEDTSLFDIVEYNMALCAYNPSNGNIEKVWDSGNIASTLAATTTPQEAEINMALTEEQGAVTPGQILFVAHRQRAQGLLMTPRSIAYAPRTTRQRPASMILRAPSYVTSAFYTGIPSSIALTSLTHVLTRLPWSGIKVEAAA
jgi:hypothetical protein